MTVDVFSFPFLSFLWTLRFETGLAVGNALKAVMRMEVGLFGM